MYVQVEINNKINVFETKFISHIEGKTHSMSHIYPLPLHGSFTYLGITPLTQIGLR